MTLSLSQNAQVQASIHAPITRNAAWRSLVPQMFAQQQWAQMCAWLSPPSTVPLTASQQALGGLCVEVCGRSSSSSQVTQEARIPKARQTSRLTLWLRHVAWCFFLNISADRALPQLLDASDVLLKVAGNSSPKTGGCITALLEAAADTLELLEVPDAPRSLMASQCHHMSGK
jgi:hypothetical protein